MLMVIQSAPIESTHLQAKYSKARGSRGKVVQLVQSGPNLILKSHEMASTGLKVLDDLSWKTEQSPKIPIDYMYSRALEDQIWILNPSHFSGIQIWILNPTLNKKWILNPHFEIWIPTW